MDTLFSGFGQTNCWATLNHSDHLINCLAKAGASVTDKVPMGWGINVTMFGPYVLNMGCLGEILIFAYSKVNRFFL